MSQDLSSLFPVPAHGGVLVDRFVPAAEADALRRGAAALPALSLDAREIADLELLAIGAVSPLTGFLGSADYKSVVEDLRLTDGTVWPLPLTLAVPDESREVVRPGAPLALRDAAGRVWGVLDVTEVFERDPLYEARNVYGTEDPAHPGVAYLLSRPRTLAAGPVRVLPLPEDLPFAAHRLTPRALRAEIAARGWQRVAGFQTRNPIHRAHEYLTKVALETVDGLLIHPLVGDTKSDDVPAVTRVECYGVLVDGYYPADRVLVSAFPAAMRYAGPREAIWHAICRKNYGCSHFIVGRDHAGVGDYYGTYDAQLVFDEFAPHELDIEPMFFEHTFWCNVCGSMASTKSCPHGPEDRVFLSGTKVRELLASGQLPPVEFTRPEVAEVLIDAYRIDGPETRSSSQ
jgi:ATP sulfurylase